MSVLTALVGGIVVAAAAVAVYLDATRVGVDAGTPALWAALVGLTAGSGLFTALLVPDAPLPGVLVLAALGPLLYVLERDDTLHGDDDPDPTRLPSAARTASDDGDSTGAAGDDAAENRSPDR